MGTFGDSVGQAGAKDGVGQEGPSSNALLSTVMGLLQYIPGGVQHLLAQFQRQGLGDQVASWVGPGENQAISWEQVQAAVGSEQVQRWAAQTGLSREEAAAELAALIPQVIDKLSPDGTPAEAAAVRGCSRAS